MKDRVFVDTNILIYAHDLDAGIKHKKSFAVVKRLWEEGTGVLSTQVLQEFYVNVTRKIRTPLPPPTVRAIIENYMAWHIELNGPETVLLASMIEERYRLSFWDAMIVAAARSAAVERILTEDLSHGQMLEGMLVENPFHREDA
jgi:predicted nucleic acid-binding protein